MKINQNSVMAEKSAFSSVPILLLRFLLFIIAFGWIFQLTDAQVVTQDTSDIIWQKYIWPDQCGDVKFSPDGKYIYAAINYNIVKFDAKTGDSLSTFIGHHGGFDPFRMNISALGNYIVTIDGANKALLWNCSNEKLIYNFSDSNKFAASCVDIDPNERFILIGLGDYFSVWDIKTLKKIKFFLCTGINSSTSFDVKFSHDGTKFAIVSSYTEQFTNQDKTLITLWEVGTWKKIKDIFLLGDRDWLSHLKFSFNDSLLSLMYESRVVYVNNLYTNKTIEFRSNFSGNLTNCYNIEFLPDNIHYLLSFGNDNGERSLNLYNFQIDKTEKQYNLLSLNSDCSEKIGTVITNGIYQLNYITPIISNISETTREIENIKIYKNNKLLYVEFLTMKIGNSSVEIFDIQGNRIFQNNLGFINPGLNKFELNTNLPIGVYFCEVQINNSRFSQKFQIGE